MRFFPHTLRIAALALLASASVLRAQTADPSAAAPSPSSAPVAKAGTYTVAAGDVVVAPGLPIPNGNLPWALDSTADGKAALVPVHHSALTEPASVAAEASATHTLAGAHAHTTLRTTMPVFFVHANDRTENTGDAGRGNPTGWVLVSAQSVGDARTIPHVQFSQIAQGTSCTGTALCLKAETLPGGWLRLTPFQALTAGEYVLLPVPRQPKPGVVVVYDFAVDPAAALAKDAVVAGVAPPAHKHNR